MNALCGAKALKIKIKVSVRDEMCVDMPRILLIFKYRAKKKWRWWRQLCSNGLFAHVVTFFSRKFKFNFTIILWSVGFKCQIYGVALQKACFFCRILNDFIVLLSPCLLNRILIFLGGSLRKWRAILLSFPIDTQTHTNQFHLRVYFLRLLLCLFSVKKVQKQTKAYIFYALM